MKPSAITLGSAAILLLIAGTGAWRIGAGLHRSVPVAGSPTPGSITIPELIRVSDLRQPLVEDLSTGAAADPFRPGRMGAGRGTRLPAPPPPPVAPLVLPVAPMVERAP